MCAARRVVEQELGRHRQPSSGTASQRPCWARLSCGPAHLGSFWASRGAGGPRLGGSEATLGARGGSSRAPLWPVSASAPLFMEVPNVNELRAPPNSGPHGLRGQCPERHVPSSQCTSEMSKQAGGWVGGFGAPRALAESWALKQLCLAAPLGLSCPAGPRFSS